MARWAVLPYSLGLGALLGRRVMILTTTGRVSGKPRRTPLWYLREGDTVYCFSGWGASSDWYKNLGACPHGVVRIGRRRWETQGSPVNETSRREELLKRLQEKYGRRTVRMFYHMDRLSLVAFPLDGKMRPDG
jgi:deazaflavin-dependent oxidoreductase (nitroreductase family)